MAHDAAPSFVVIRLSPPSYQCVAWPILDVSDALISLEKETVDIVKPTVFNPTLTLPQYVNDVFLGETLHLAVLLSNRHKMTFTNVNFRVNIVIDGVQSDPIVMEPFTGITLEPHKRPQTTTITHVFKHLSQHSMSFTVTFTLGKKSYQVVKRAVWNTVHPLKFNFVTEKDSNGRTHMEAIITNVSKLVMTISDVKLLTPNDSTMQDCIYKKNEDINALCILTPNATNSMIFKDINTQKMLSLRTFWHCYERGIGEIVTPIGALGQEAAIAYTVLENPGTVKPKEEFTIVVKITNLYESPLQCKLKFNDKHFKSLIVQIDDYLDLGTINHQDHVVVDVPLMCLSTGIHSISGMEIHAEPDVVVPITNLEVLAI